MSETIHQLDLPALDGANPLGFLAALGTLTILSETDRSVRLGWHARARWTPFLTSPNPFEESEVLQRLATGLRGQSVDTEKERLRAAAQKRFDAAKKELKSAVDRFKKRGLRGKERDTVRAQEILPREEALSVARDELLSALKGAVPSPELALGQRPDCTIEEFRRNACRLRSESKFTDLTTVSLLASFGAEVSDDVTDRILPTPFCFITGSGHQWFLDTARELMAVATDPKLREALFEPWAYTDQKLTMRWDPLDDRRYALMDRDPTASDNKSSTVWMANLLAYRALTFFPCTSRSQGLMAAGWNKDGESDRFTWALWKSPLSADTVRSLLRHPAFGEPSCAAYRNQLRARGVTAIFRARRIQVGNPPLHKINFSPAIAL